MTRKTDRLEVLARDLASRYGEADMVVQSVRAAIALPAAPVNAKPRADERRHLAQGPMARKRTQNVQAARA